VKIIRYVTVSILLTYSSLSYAADAVKVTPPQQKTLSNPSGRYVFGQISEYRKDQYMLDTQTGRLWSITVTNLAKEGAAPVEMTALSPVLYSDFVGNEYNELPLPARIQK